MDAHLMDSQGRSQTILSGCTEALPVGGGILVTFLIVPYTFLNILFLQSGRGGGCRGGVTAFTVGYVPVGYLLYICNVCNRRNKEVMRFGLEKCMYCPKTKSSKNQLPASKIH